MIRYREGMSFDVAAMPNSNDDASLDLLYWKRPTADLLADEVASRVHGERDFFKARVRDNHRIPIPRSDSAEQSRTPRSLEILFACGQNVRRWIQREQLR